MSIDNKRKKPTTAFWLLLLLLLVFVLLASIYSIINPLYEATDELRHYRFVRVIATTGKLPIQGEEPCRSQSHHPPLIYAIGALSTAWIDGGNDICDKPLENPFWAYRYWDVGRDNKNQYLHGPEEEFPWSGDALAAHISRFINIFVGAGVVLLTWLTARIVWSNKLGIAFGAAAIVAFNPMFLYMSAAINNDVIAAFSGAAVTFACLRVIFEPSRLTWRYGLVFGFLLGLALMSKFNLAAVIVLIEIATIWAAWKKPFSMAESISNTDSPQSKSSEKMKRLQLVVVVNVLLFVVAGLISGWWFVRNIRLYGEPTGFEQVTQLWGSRDPLASFGLAISELPYAWTTLWGRFGFGQIPLPELFYSALKIFVLAGFIGVLIGYFRRAKVNERRVLIFLSANVVLFFIVLFNYMLVSPAGPNGRFFFPAISAFAILLSYGVYQLLTEAVRQISRWKNRASVELEGPQTPNSLANVSAAIISAAMFLLAIVVLIFYLQPAYAQPPSLPANALISNPVNANFDGLINLLGYEISDSEIMPGQPLDLTLYWEVTGKPPGNYLLFVHLMDEAQTMVAQRDTHPGLGNFPSSQWQPGDRFVESIRLYVPETAFVPSEATISIGYYASGAYRLAVYDQNKDPMGDSIELATLELTPSALSLPNPQNQNFNQELSLVGYDIDEREVGPGDLINLTLYWQSLKDVGSDYLVQAKLVDEEGRDWVTVEGRPADGESATFEWRSGQQILDNHQLAIPLDMPAGRYSIVVSLIDTHDGSQPSIVADDGHLIDTHLALAQIRVVESQ